VLSACRSNFVEVACTTQKVEKACSKLYYEKMSTVRIKLLTGDWVKFNSIVCHRKLDSSEQG